MTNQMTMMLNTAKLLGIVTFGAVAGTVADRPGVIDNNTHIPLGPAIAVVVVLIGLAWNFAGWKQGITDSLEELKKGQDRLNRRLDKLPCKTEDDCPGK